MSCPVCGAPSRERTSAVGPTPTRCQACYDSHEATNAPHGSYVRYTIAKCRCDACREANRIQRAESERRKREGRSLFVDAGPVRERWMKLRGLGMNDDEIERAAGVSHHTSQNLFRAHQRSGKPVNRMKRETADKIMAVRHRSIKPGQRVPSAKSREYVLDIMALGYSRSWICDHIGVSISNFSVLTAGEVRFSTHEAIHKLWGMTTAPRSERNRFEAFAASRARQFSAKHRPKNPRQSVDRDRVEQMLRDDRPAHEIAEVCGCATRTVMRIKAELREVAA